MKITKTRLKQIIKEELEAVVNEEEEETTTEGTDTDEEAVEEAYAGARPGPSHRDRPGYQKATVRGRVDARPPGGGDTPTLDAAADAVGMTPSQLMMDLAKEMGAIGGTEADAEPPLEMPEGE